MTRDTQLEPGSHSIIELESEEELSATMQMNLERFEGKKIEREQFQLIVKILSHDWWAEILSSPQWDTEPVTREVVIQRISDVEDISELSAWVICSMLFTGIPLDQSQDLEMKDVSFDSPELVWITAMTVNEIEEQGICPRFSNQRRSYELDPCIIFDSLSSGDAQKTVGRDELIHYIERRTEMGWTFAESAVDRMIKDGFFEITDQRELVLQEWVHETSMFDRERIHITSPFFRGA